MITRDFVEELAQGRIVTTILDDGTKHIEHHDALIGWLRSAVASSLVGGQVAGGGRSSIPLDADALEKLQHIEHQIMLWYRDAGLGIPGHLPEENLLKLYAHRWQTYPDTAPDDELRAWHRTILDKLDPIVTVPLKDPCPVCRATHFTNDDGDLCASPIVVDYRRADPFATVKAACRACDVEWVGAEAISELVTEWEEVFDTPDEATV